MKAQLDGAASGEFWITGYVYPSGSTDHVGGHGTATLPNAGTVTFRPLYWNIPGYNSGRGEHPGPLRVLAGHRRLVEVRTGGVQQRNRYLTVLTRN